MVCALNFSIEMFIDLCTLFFCRSWWEPCWGSAPSGTPLTGAVKRIAAVCVLQDKCSGEDCEQTDYRLQVKNKHLRSNNRCLTLGSHCLCEQASCYNAKLSLRIWMLNMKHCLVQICYNFSFFNLPFSLLISGFLHAGRLASCNN